MQNSVIKKKSESQIYSMAKQNPELLKLVHKRYFVYLMNFFGKIFLINLYVY